MEMMIRTASTTMSQAARGRTAEAEAGASLGVANGPVTAHQAPVHNPLAAALPAIVGRLASGGPRAQAGERAHSSPTGAEAECAGAALRTTPMAESAQATRRL